MACVPAATPCNRSGSACAARDRSRAPQTHKAQETCCNRIVKVPTFHDTAPSQDEIRLLASIACRSAGSGTFCSIPLGPAADRGLHFFLREIFFTLALAFSSSSCATSTIASATAATFASALLIAATMPVLGEAFLLGLAALLALAAFFTLLPASVTAAVTCLTALVAFLLTFFATFATFLAADLGAAFGLAFIAAIFRQFA